MIERRIEARQRQRSYVREIHLMRSSECALWW
jgi:hypothetical protein